MKFRCKISNEGVKILLSLVLSLLKIHDQATVLLSDDYIRLVIISDELIENPRIYIELSSSLLCSEYRIESQHVQNTIIFELSLAIFAKALASGKYSTHSIFKLTKKDGKPYFTMECKASESLLSIDLIHDLPIQLIRVYDFSLYVPPTISKPPIAFTLPKNRILKTLIERLTKINKIVYLIAQAYSSSHKLSEDPSNSSSSGRAIQQHQPTSESGEGRGLAQYGQLKIQADNHNVKIQSFLNNLLISNKLDDNNNDEGVDHIVGGTGKHYPVVVSVYSKKLTSILDYHMIPHLEASLFLTPNEALMLHLELAPIGLGSVSYYLPVLVNEDSLITESSADARHRNSSSSSKKRVDLDIGGGAKKATNTRGFGYDNIDIETLKQTVDRESFNRRRKGSEKVEESENEDDDQSDETAVAEDDETSEDFLWRDNSVLKDQYKAKAVFKLQDRNEDDDEEEEEEEESEEEEVVQPRKGMLSVNNSASRGTKKDAARRFLYSE